MNLYKTRRKKYLTHVKNDSITIIFGNREKYRNNDVKYRFRQNSNFLYLIGLDEPDAIAIIEKTSETKSITTIFSKSINRKDIIWEDSILGQEEIISKYKIEYAYPIEIFQKAASQFLKNKRYIYLICENRRYYKKYINSILKKIKY